MKRLYMVFTAIPLLVMSISTTAQVTRTRTAAVVTNPIPTAPANISQFQVEGALITQNSFIAPVPAANLTGSFSATARWNSMGNLNAGVQTLNGFRTQTNGRALGSGHTIQNATGLLSNPLIQWVGNSAVGVTPGNLEFRYGLNPGGPGLPATDVLLFSMVPNAAGTEGDSYAQNGILGQLTSGTFGDITGASQWLGHGSARIGGVLDPTIYGNRIQQGAQSMLFNLVSGKPVVGWGDQGQDMVFRYFPNRFNPAVFTDVLTLESSGRSSFGPSFNPNAKVNIRGNEDVGLAILVKTNSTPVQTGSEALVITATQDAYGYIGLAQSDATTNTGLRGEAGITGGSVASVNTGVYGTINANTTGTVNYGVYGIVPPSFGTAAFTAGGYFIGGLYADALTVFSDQKLKSDVQNEGDITARIMKLRPVTYQLDQNRKGYNFTNKLQHGFIAQEMEKVFPELVNDIKHPITEKGSTKIEDIKGVNYIGLISVLTRGMQEQQQQITKQDDRIATLEKEIQSLKQAMEAISGAAPAKTAPVAATAGYELKQNLPNPFSESTVIFYTVPATEKNASIAVFDLNGRMITQFSNLSGKNQLTIRANDLQPGIYLYSLLSGGQEMMTKRMVITK